MSGISPEARSSLQTPNEQTLQQPADPAQTVVEDQETAKEQTQDGQEIDGPTTHPGPATTETAEADPTSKGKDKEEPPPLAEKQREDDSLSIGPDLPPPAVSGSHVESPVCTITLLLPTGARHPYRIDEKYLAKRNVQIPDVTKSGAKDPFSISVYKLKELILREWREEWEGKPASPSSIRLIHFGKLLDDKEQLKKYQFSADSPNVVHMSVRPAEMMEEEEAGKGGKSSTREGRTREGGSGCCVIL
ncbi:hypothetical protein VTK56DRAFT_4966 [Thermocarpiscus australiensis]